MQVIVCRYKQAQLVQQVAGISSSLKLMKILQDGGMKLSGMIRGNENE